MSSPETILLHQLPDPETGGIESVITRLAGEKMVRLDLVVIANREVVSHTTRRW